MKTITSAVLGLSLTLAVAGLGFAQTPAAQAPAKDSTMNSAPAKKQHVKKHKKASSTTPAATSATPATPAGK